MANAVKEQTGDFGKFETKRYDVKEKKVTIPYEVQLESVAIRGMERAEAADAGKFTVAVTPASDGTPASTVITFAEGDFEEGETIRVSYKRRSVNASRVAISTTTPMSKGEVYATWPVYSSGTDCTESTQKGELQIHLYRVRVSAAPGFDTSYKTAATNSVTFSSIDPKRADGKMWSLSYEPFDSDGNVVTTSDEETVDWT